MMMIILTAMFYIPSDDHHVTFVLLTMSASMALVMDLVAELSPWHALYFPYITLSEAIFANDKVLP